METISHTDSPTASSDASRSYYIAQIQANSLTSSESTTKPFTQEELVRVLDFDHMTAPPPATTKLRVLLQNNKFQECECTLRGGYLFYIRVKGGNEEDTTVPCIPLYQCVVEFPPGGRRVFRDHVNFEGVSKGYEFAIRAKQDGTPDTILGFIVADKLSIREEWSNGIKHRADIRRETKLRLMGDTDRASAKAGGAAGAAKKTTNGISVDASDFRTSTFHKRMALTQTVMGDSQPDKDVLQSALRDFGSSQYNENKWINTFFRDHAEFESPDMSRTLESYLREVRQGLRGMVLDQYECFVEASKEMTVLGKETFKVRDLWQEQMATIDQMKIIDFQGTFSNLLDEKEGMRKSIGNDDGSLSDDSSFDGLGNSKPKPFTVSMLISDPADTSDSSDEDDSSIETDDSDLNQGGRKNIGKRNLSKRSLSSSKSKKSEGTELQEDKIEEIQLPTSLTEAVDDISNFFVQCRYTQASNLILKTKNDIENILVSPNRQIPSKQVTILTQIQNDLEHLTVKMCKHLFDQLRRKNESLRSTLKRDRSSSSHIMELMLLPLVSPTCLDDDKNDLNILIKHGRTQEAATAYAARRTLLVNEYLNERPIAGQSAVIMDLVIYAAQLSTSFFACLSSSVEGFLDLFLALDNEASPEADNEANSFIPPSNETNAILSNEIMNKIPAGALSSIVFWCDAELQKFANFFGGPKVLGILALNSSQKESDQSNPNESEKSGSDRGLGKSMSSTGNDKQITLEVAAKCLDQVFRQASESLDAIGLPLSCKLADYLRVKLKGSEHEIGLLLNDKWNHVVYTWINDSVINANIASETRRAMLKAKLEEKNMVTEDKVGEKEPEEKETEDGEKEEKPSEVKETEQSSPENPPEAPPQPKGELSALERLKQRKLELTSKRNMDSANRSQMRMAAGLSASNLSRESVNSTSQHSKDGLEPVKESPTKETTQSHAESNATPAPTESVSIGSQPNEEVSKLQLTQSKELSEGPADPSRSMRKLETMNKSYASLALPDTNA